MSDKNEEGFRPVILETPYPGDVEHNAKYLQKCIRDCIRRGDSPYISHQMLTSTLDDKKEKEYKKSIIAGLAWHALAEASIVYIDRGITNGMHKGIIHAYKQDLLIEYRSFKPESLEVDNIDVEISS